MAHMDELIIFWCSEVKGRDLSHYRQCNISGTPGGNVVVLFLKARN